MISAQFPRRGFALATTSGRIADPESTEAMAEPAGSNPSPRNTTFNAPLFQQLIAGKSASPRLVSERNFAGLGLFVPQPCLSDGPRLPIAARAGSADFRFSESLRHFFGELRTGRIPPSGTKVGNSALARSLPRTLGGGDASKRGMIKPLDLLPAFSVHGLSCPVSLDRLPWLRV